MDPRQLTEEQLNHYIQQFFAKDGCLRSQGHFYAKLGLEMGMVMVDGFSSLLAKCIEQEENEFLHGLLEFTNVYMITHQDKLFIEFKLYPIYKALLLKYREGLRLGPTLCHVISVTLGTIMNKSHNDTLIMTLRFFGELPHLLIDDEAVEAGLYVAQMVIDVTGEDIPLVSWFLSFETLCKAISNILDIKTASQIQRNVDMGQWAEDLLVALWYTSREEMKAVFKNLKGPFTEIAISMIMNYGSTKHKAFIVPIQSPKTAEVIELPDESAQTCRIYNVCDDSPETTPRSTQKMQPSSLKKSELQQISTPGTSKDILTSEEKSQISSLIKAELDRISTPGTSSFDSITVEKVKKETGSIIEEVELNLTARIYYVYKRDVLPTCVASELEVFKKELEKNPSDDEKQVESSGSETSMFGDNKMAAKQSILNLLRDPAVNSASKENLLQLSTEVKESSKHELHCEHIPVQQSIDQPPQHIILSLNDSVSETKCEDDLNRANVSVDSLVLEVKESLKLSGQRLTDKENTQEEHSSSVISIVAQEVSRVKSDLVDKVALDDAMRAGADSELKSTAESGQYISISELTLQSSPLMLQTSTGSMEYECEEDSNNTGQRLTDKENTQEGHSSRAISSVAQEVSMVKSDLVDKIALDDAMRAEAGSKLKSTAESGQDIIISEPTLQSSPLMLQTISTESMESKCEEVSNITEVLVHSHVLESKEGIKSTEITLIDKDSAHEENVPQLSSIRPQEVDVESNLDDRKALGDVSKSPSKNVILETESFPELKLKNESGQDLYHLEPTLGSRPEISQIQGNIDENPKYSDNSIKTEDTVDPLFSERTESMNLTELCLGGNETTPEDQISDNTHDSETEKIITSSQQDLSFREKTQGPEHCRQSSERMSEGREGIDEALITDICFVEKHGLDDPHDSQVESSCILMSESGLNVVKSTSNTDQASLETSRSNVQEECTKKVSKEVTETEKHGTVNILHSKRSIWFSESDSNHEKTASNTDQEFLEAHESNIHGKCIDKALKNKQSGSMTPDDLEGDQASLETSQSNTQEECTKKASKEVTETEKHGTVNILHSKRSIWFSESDSNHEKTASNTDQEFLEAHESNIHGKCTDKALENKQSGSMTHDDLEGDQASLETSQSNTQEECAKKASKEVTETEKHGTVNILHSKRSIWFSESDSNHEKTASNTDQAFVEAHQSNIHGKCTDKSLENKQSSSMTSDDQYDFLGLCFGGEHKPKLKSGDEKTEDGQEVLKSKHFDKKEENRSHLAVNEEINQDHEDQNATAEKIASSDLFTRRFTKEELESGLPGSSSQWKELECEPSAANLSVTTKSSYQTASASVSRFKSIMKFPSRVISTFRSKKFESQTTVNEEKGIESTVEESDDENLITAKDYEKATKKMESQLKDLNEQIEQRLKALQEARNEIQLLRARLDRQNEVIRNRERQIKALREKYGVNL